jgi:hypothetical protein
LSASDDALRSPFKSLVARASFEKSGRVQFNFAAKLAPKSGKWSVSPEWIVSGSDWSSTFKCSSSIQLGSRTLGARSEVRRRMIRSAEVKLTERMRDVVASGALTWRRGGNMVFKPSLKWSEPRSSSLLGGSLALSAQIDVPRHRHRRARASKPAKLKAVGQRCLWPRGPRLKVAADSTGTLQTSLSHRGAAVSARVSANRPTQWTLQLDVNI